MTDDAKKTGKRATGPKKTVAEASDEKFRSLLENIPDVVWTSDEDGNTTYISEGVTKIFGFTPVEIYRDPNLWFGRIHTDDVGRVRKAFEELILRGTLFDIEYRLQRKDGVWIWVHDRAAKTYRRDDVRYVDGIFRDITQHKMVEEALQKSEANYRSLFENSTIGIVVTGPNLMFQRVNAAFCKMLEYCEEELVGKKSIGDVTHPDDRPTSKELLGKLLRKDIDQFIVEKRYIAKSGKIIFALNFSQGLYDNTGLYINGTASIFDITKRKRLEEELRQNRDHLEDLIRERTHELEVQNAKLSQEIAERKRVEDALRESESRLKDAQSLGRIGNWEFDFITQKITWSDQTYRLYDRDPVLGPPTPEEEAKFYPADQVQKVRNFARLAAEEGRSFTYDLDAKLLNGKQVFLSATMQPIKDAQGRVTKLFGTVQDITEQKKIEQERQLLLEKTMQISDLKSNLITQAAHELKTPLTAILGWGELLFNAKREGKNLDATFDIEDLESIVRNAERLNDLITDFLDVGRIESGKFEISKQDIDFNEIIENATRAVDYLATRKNITISTEIAPAIAIPIDRRRMEQVIINLLSNAIKYSPERARVLIKTGPIELSGRKMFEVRIIDEGYGFTPEELAEAMTPFGKAYTIQKKKRTVQGTGLGLFISLHIVEQHGGTLVIRSEGANKGTTVEVLLPMNK